MDYLKEQVVDAIFSRTRKVDGDGIYDIYDELPTIEVLEKLGDLKLKLRVKTPTVPRFFLVIVKEVKYG